MERTSIITALYIADSKDYPALTLVDGLPNPASLSSFFQKVPLVMERADLRETTEDSDQGDLLDIAIRANIYRDEDFYLDFSGKFVLAYLETANGEKHFLGTQEHPLSYRYTRNTGATNSDNRETNLLMGLKTAI